MSPQTIVVALAQRGKILPQTWELLTLGRRLADASKTPLMAVLPGGGPETARELVERGADMRKADASGYTPLEIALGDEKLFAARALIEAGAPVNTANGGQKVTPLMLIASKISPQARTTQLASGPTPIEIGR